MTKNSSRTLGGLRPSIFPSIFSMSAFIDFFSSILKCSLWRSNPTFFSDEREKQRVFPEVHRVLFLPIHWHWDSPGKKAFYIFLIVMKILCAETKKCLKEMLVFVGERNTEYSYTEVLLMIKVHDPLKPHPVEHFCTLLPLQIWSFSGKKNNFFWLPQQFYN